IPHFDLSELEKILTFTLNDSTLLKFVTTINESNSNFCSHFISISEECIEESDDSWNTLVLVNCILSLNKEQETQS
ncbi:MAG: hypothetical protein RR369_00620, partial [Lachnospiraceae bacterium]